MKKLIFLTLIISIFAGSLISCSGDEGLVYYGVAEFSKEHNMLLVNIPSVGRCEIPAAKKISSELDGASRAEIEDGDLIKINFGKVDDVAIMEMYPARFSAVAEEIVITAEDIGVSFEYVGTTPVCYLTEPSTPEISGANIGDYVAFCEGGRGLDNVYCYGEVYMKLNNGKIVVKLELVNGIHEFLSKYPMLEQKIVKID